MYRVIAKYHDAYAVMDTSTTKIEALTDKELKSVLYFGEQIEGVSFTPTGDLVELNPIPVMSDEDVNNDNVDEYEDFDDEDWDEDEEDFEEDTEDDDEDYEDFDDGEVDEEDYDTIDEDEDEDMLLYYDDFEDDEYESRSTVQKLYDFLDDEQVKLLKRYYLWYSQKLFVNAKKDPTLGMKDKNRLMRKKEDLNTLRNTGGMWHYAGFIDMGYDGAGYCTLGHPLRYMHIAWDVSQSDIESTFFGDDYDKDFEDLLESNNCITFGIKCISDFFEVDSECTQSLQKAQRESLKDMALMYEQYNAGEVKEICETYKLMDEVIRRIKRVDGKAQLFGGDDYKPILPAGYIQFYTQFRELLMPVPKSLIQEIRDNIVGWHSHKFYGTIGNPNAKFTDNLVSIFGAKLKKCKDELVFRSNIFYYSATWFDLVYRYYTQFFVYEICGHFKFNGETNSDEGGKSKKVKEEFDMLYLSQKRNFAQDAEFTMEYADKVAGVCNQVQTLREQFTKFADEIHSYFKQEDRSIDTYLKRWRNVANSDCNVYTMERRLENPDMFGKTGFGKLPTLNSVLDIFNEEFDSYKNFFEFAKQAIADDKRIEEEKRRREEEESKPASVGEVMDYVRAHGGITSPSRKFDFHTKLWNQFATKTEMPSKKQQYYINGLFTELTGRTVEAPQATESEQLDDYPEYEKAARYIIAHGESSIVRDVCKSVVRYGKFSAKQKHYLDEAVTLYKSATL